jgi:hypothetical protein
LAGGAFQLRPVSSTLHRFFFSGLFAVALAAGAAPPAPAAIVFDFAFAVVFLAGVFAAMG